MPGPIPSFGTLRLARVSDLWRIGFVSAASFYHSTFFPYYRPLYQAFPNDTVASYRFEAHRAILNSSTIVLVAEDSYKEDEIDSVYEALKPIYPFKKDGSGNVPKAGEKVIVGLIFLSLENDPERKGKFNPEEPGTEAPDHDPEDLKRDQSSEALKIFGDTLHESEEKWMKDHMEVTSICVHPAYWSKGHGEALSKWCVALADVDEVPLVVSASPMGHALFSRMGFEERELVVVPGYEKHPEPIDIWFGQRPVPQRASSEL